MRLIRRAVEQLSHSDSLRSVLFSSSWLLSGNAVSAALGLVQTLIVARVLGPESLGVLALVMTYTSTVNQFVDSRVWETAIKFLTKYREEGRHSEAAATIKVCYLVDFVTALIAFGILMMSSNFAARVLVKDAAATGLIRLYALTVLVSVPVGTSTAILRVGGRFDWLAYHAAVVAALRLVGVLVVVLLGASISRLLLVYASAVAIGACILSVIAWRVSAALGLLAHMRAPISLLRGQYRGLTRFLAVTNAAALLKLLQRSADVLLVGFWLGPREVGYLRVARAVADMLGFPLAPVYAAAYPEFARLWHAGRADRLRDLARRLTFLSMGGGLGGALLLYVAAAPLVRLLFGPNFLPVVGVLHWLLLGTAIAVATTFGHPLLLAMGKEVPALLAFVAGAFSQLVCLTAFVPRFGVEGAGAAYLGFYLVWSCVAVVLLRPLWTGSVSPPPAVPVTGPSS